MRRTLSAVPGLILASFLMTSCSKPVEKPDLSKLTEDFVYGTLALSPVSATSAGYHEHNGVHLDGKIDDFSQAGIAEQHKFYSDFRDRLAKIQQSSLSRRRPGRLRDHRRIRSNLSLLELDEIQSYRHNPTVYVELIGNALFNPFVLEYAPIETRYRDIISAAPDGSRADAIRRRPIWWMRRRSGTAWRAKRMKAIWI